MSLVSNIRFFPVNGNKIVKAGGKMVIANVVEVAFSIFDGKNGLWVKLPGHFGNKEDENGKKPWFSDVSFVSEDLRNEINSEVLEAFGQFRTAPNSSSVSSSSAPKKTGFPTPKKVNESSITDDGIPF